MCRNGVQTPCWLRLLDGALPSNNIHEEVYWKYIFITHLLYTNCLYMFLWSNKSYKKKVFDNKAISRAISGNSLPKRHDGQSLGQDFKNAGSKQQFQNICPSTITYLSTANPYTN